MNATTQRTALMAIAATSALYEALQQLAFAKGSVAFTHVDFGGDPTILRSDMDELELTEKLSDLVIASFEVDHKAQES